MATDIVFNQGGDGDHIVVEANVVEAKAFDFELNSPQRHKGGASSRRALVHDQSDGLTINYNGDYPAGVSVVAANINLRTIEQDRGFPPDLPHDGQRGDLLLVHTIKAIGIEIVGEDLTLWLCIGPGGGGILTGGGSSSYWKQIQLGDAIRGLG